MNRELRRNLASGMTGLGLMALLLLAAGKARGQPDGIAFKPGLWSLSRTMTGGPGGSSRSGTQEVCFDAATLARDPVAPIRVRPPAGDAKAPQCVITDLKTAGAKASYSTVCKGPMGRIRGVWTGTHDAEHFAMTGQMKAMFMTMTAQFSGRFLGACKP